MRRLLALLTTIALLYACRQESPERQIPEPPITTGGELTGQGPTLSLSADVLPLGRVAGDFDASDEPRSTTGRIDPKAEDGKFIKLLAQSDSTHPGAAPSRPLYLPEEGRRADTGHPPTLSPEGGL